MNYYNEIKNKLINNKITKKVKDYSKNKSDLETYYNVGKLLFEAENHYGDGVIKNYSKRLTSELGKGYTQTRLKYFRKFYDVFSKSPTLSDELTFSHYCELIWLEERKRQYYIIISINQHLSVRQLREKIKNNEYERLPNKAKLNLNKNINQNINNLIKNPIYLNNKNNYVQIKEKILQKIVLENIKEFMEELGNGFCFIGNEYKIKIGNRYNYIDLLLYNYIYNCFIVIELKTTELKKEHIGQIETYINYIDKHKKSINQNKTIGIIIVKKDNKYIMEYVSDKRIFRTTYILN